MSSINKASTVTAKRRITGQGMTEYIIVVALISIAAVSAVAVFGTAIQAQFGNLTSALMGDPGTTTVAPAAVKEADLKTFAN